jgi:FMN phosphatase YigB (HAD superfamily)
VIQAITFDFWNTLFVANYAGDERLRGIKQVLERKGHLDISELQIERATSFAWQEWDRVWEQECRTFGAREWVALVFTRLGVSLAPSERDMLVRVMETSGMATKPPLVDGLNAVLPRLTQHYRLGVICDTGLSPGWMLRDWMDVHGILKHFSHLTFSDELGVSKPHPDAFLSTLAQLGVSPEDAVHIGDFPRTDIAGAKGVGMRAIRFTGVYDWDIGTAHADAEIAAYTELEPLLREWGN